MLSIKEIFTQLDNNSITSISKLINIINVNKVTDPYTFFIILIAKANAPTLCSLFLGSFMLNNKLIQSPGIDMQKKQDMTTTVNQMMNDISILSLSEFLLIGFEKSDHEFSFNETISIKNIQYELISLIVNEHQDNSYSIYVKNENSVWVHYSENTSRICDHYEVMNNNYNKKRMIYDKNTFEYKEYESLTEGIIFLYKKAKCLNLIEEDNEEVIDINKIETQSTDNSTETEEHVNSIAKPVTNKKLYFLTKEILIANKDLDVLFKKEDLMSIHNTLPYLNQPFKNIYHMMTTLSDQLGVSINEVDLYYVMIPTENESITVQFIPKQKYNNYFLQQFNENIFYIHSKQSSLVKKNNNKWEFINRIPLKNKEQLKLDFSKKKLIVTYQMIINVGRI